MEKQEVISRFCDLSRLVIQVKYDYSIPADCFCGQNGGFEIMGGFQYSEKVILFIEQAVKEKLGKMALPVDQFDKIDEEI